MIDCVRDVCIMALARDDLGPTYYQSIIREILGITLTPAYQKGCMMKWSCCGVEIETNFCPQCGNACDAPLMELVNHLKESIARGKSKGDAASDTTKKNVQRSERWLDALLEVL